ncbi:MAG: endonuclease/exonuclease/phosphatase family protein [Candidatus Hydrogenedentes bacterium]|jgi:endonuclease/exonuclease/phosphatase family metal-dependent hydrolase|nr:endonuclease/exonuclease/phosphatase family protein [Candidatus Hydrogenedentota bacterium]
MFKRLLLIICIMGCFWAQAEMDLKVMSFNVRFGTANDGDNAWPHRKESFINVIKKQSPDLLGTQECLAFQADYIVEQLPEYRWIGIDRDVSGKGEMTAIFYRKDAFFPLESGNFWLSETPDVPASKSWDTSLTRIATWVHFYHPETQSTFYYYNTHLDHRGPEARKESVALIAKHIEAKAGGQPVILTGDFNAYAEKSAPYDVAMENGFTDAWRVAKEQIGPTVTFTAFKDPGDAENKRIDWILLKGNFEVSTCETDTYIENGRLPSDHYPVIGTMRLLDN